MGDPVYNPIIRVALGLIRSLHLEIAIEGQELVPATGGGVVVINHTGYLDFILAGVPFWRADKRLVRYMAKDDVFRNPVSGPLMRGMKHIPVDRSAGAAAYAKAVEALRSGELVGVFPEATISQSFELKEFKNGAARMAQEAGVPLIPVVLWGSQRIWTKGRERAMRRDGRHGRVAISVGAPQQVPAGVDTGEATATLKAAMQAQLHALQDSYGVVPRGADDRWWLPARLGGAAPTPEQAAQLDADEAVAKAARRAAKAAKKAA